MTPNASDRKSVRELEKRARIAERERAEVITAIMSTRAGRSWMWDRLSSCHVFVTTFNGDALQSAFQEGQRSMGLALLADIMAHCPDQYIQAMRESHERSITDSVRDATLNTDPDAERRLGPQPDGGDSGALPDSSDAAADPVLDSTFGWNPGADIYAEVRSQT